MDTRNPTCNWPSCADENDNCRIGLSMPCTIHPPIDGENLTRARSIKPDRSRYDFAKFIAVSCMIGLAWFVLCAMGWRVVV